MSIPAGILKHKKEARESKRRPGPTPVLEKQKRKPRATKLTEQDHEERTSLCREMLGLSYYKWQIKKAYREKFGPTSARTIETYISRARGQMLENYRRKAEEHASDALTFYEKMKRDVNNSTKDRLRAQENIDQLVGSRAPERKEISGPDGAPLIPTTFKEAMAQIAAEEAAAAQPKQ